ncbi:MAG TPA: type II secretion system F family protein [Aestuariivirga sp.]|nr:type II secretion system F family protein [Aestuariivirga sp.]
MMGLISELMKMETAVTLLVAVATFATVLTLAMPMFQSDKLNSRIKGVTQERDRLRAAQKAALAAGSEAKLRDSKKSGVTRQLVDVLNLRKVFEAETSREFLRKAGLRNESHLFTYLVVRMVVPIVAAIGVFLYTSFVYTTPVATTTRLAMAMGGLIAGFYMPALVLKNMISKRQESIRRAWSDALDLLLICVESGMSVEPAMTRVAREIGRQSVPLSEELTLTVAELSFLQDRRKAFENLGKRVDIDTVRSVVTSLIQAERYGTPLGTALRVLAQENREVRMQFAEKKAAALPPKLTVPMILFFLPIIFVVILGPSIIMVMNVQ